MVQGGAPEEPRLELVRPKVEDGRKGGYPSGWSCGVQQRSDGPSGTDCREVATPVDQGRSWPAPLNEQCASVRVVREELHSACARPRQQTGRLGI